MVVNLAINFQEINKFSAVAAWIALALGATIQIMSLAVFAAACCHLNPCSKCLIVIFGIILALLLLTVGALSGFAIWSMEVLSLEAPEMGSSEFEKSVLQQRNDLVQSTFQKCCIENKPPYGLLPNVLASSTNANNTIAGVNITRSRLANPADTAKVITDKIINGWCTCLILRPRSTVFTTLNVAPDATTPFKFIFCPYQYGRSTYRSHVSILIIRSNHGTRVVYVA